MAAGGGVLARSGWEGGKVVPAASNDISDQRSKRTRATTDVVQSPPQPEADEANVRGRRSASGEHNHEQLTQVIICRIRAIKSRKKQRLYENLPVGNHLLPSTIARP